MCSLLLTGLLLGTPTVHAEEVYLANLGVTATLPPGWSIPRWSDWDLEGVDLDKTTKARVWSTPFQLEPTPEAAQAWAEQTVEWLVEQEHKDGKVVRAEVVEWGGGPAAAIEIAYTYKSGQAAVLHQRSVAIAGQVMHVSTTAMGWTANRSGPALAKWLDAIEIEKPAKWDSEGMERETSFMSPMPMGWRHPFGSELSETRKLAADRVKIPIDGDCWVVIQPYAPGDTDLLFSCRAHRFLGVVDEHSYPGADALIRERFFAGISLEDPRIVETGDRLSLIYTLPDMGGQSIRVGVTPYADGLVMTYGATIPERVSGVESALDGALQNMTFVGPDGGRHPVGLAAWLSYAASYRPELLAAAATPVLLFFGFMIHLSRRPKKSWADNDI